MAGGQFRALVGPGLAGQGPGSDSESESESPNLKAGKIAESKKKSLITKRRSFCHEPPTYNSIEVAHVMYLSIKMPIMFFIF